ncbi:MAG TPA: DEAD/DEAH box helicase [Solirubrobacteraceae bacterium]|jgi:superfamily II DNA/RNA helicase|nr:DEAD/DEAH box helicase [Solirubrobacteraceae bacterium]
MQSFADLGVSRAVVHALSQEGVAEPFAIQRLVISDVLAGRDVLARSPTGSGKTLAFGIPLVDRIQSDGPRPAALILAPTRELATQIADDIRSIAHARALSVTAVYGGVGLVKQAKQAARSHILVATPGRLEDLMARGAFTLDAISLLVLDEADRMLDMGFRPAVDRIVGACPPGRQTLFFSATLDGEAGTIAQHYTADAARHEHGPTGRRAAADVEHRFVPVAAGDRIEALVAELEADRELALVFVRTKRGVDRLVKRLGSRGVDAVAMHGNKSQRQREVALSRFESGAVDTLVATDVAARGIDVAGVSHVINFDPPADHDTYVHRVGRTGRAGRSGVGITLVESHERRELAALADHLGIEHGLVSGGGRSDHRRSDRPKPVPARTGHHRPTHPDNPARGRRPRRRRNRPAQPDHSRTSRQPARD